MSLPLNKFPGTALAGNLQPVLRVQVRVRVRKPQPLPVPWVTLPATWWVLQTRDNHYPAANTPIIIPHPSSLLSNVDVLVIMVDTL